MTSWTMTFCIVERRKEVVGIKMCESKYLEKSYLSGGPRPSSRDGDPGLPGQGRGIYNVLIPGRV